MESGLRREYLTALGIQYWVPRGLSSPAVDEFPALPEVPEMPSRQEMASLPAAPASGSAASKDAGRDEGKPRQPAVDAIPELPSWLTEGPPDDESFVPFAKEEAGEDFGFPVRPRIPPVESLDWESLAERVSACTGCELCRTRTKTVFGVGDRHARLMVIGEAPGADEDRQGEPFVGRAGQLLTAMLLALGFRREQVYIANILKCRPPGNRDPHIDEVVRCSAYLRRQIALVQPRVIVAVGRIAAQNLLQSEQPVGKLRGVEHRYGEAGIPLVVSYHPAYLLRTPEQKGAAWLDWQRAARLLQGP